MPFTPTKLMTVSITDMVDHATWPLDDGWQDYPYQWSCTLVVSTMFHSSKFTRLPYYYNGEDIKVGDCIVTAGQGRILKIVEILPTPTADEVDCILEDYNRENILQDDTQSGSGGIPSGDGWLFEVRDGVPIIHPIPDALLGSIPSYFASDILARFLNNKTDKELYVDQVAHGFSVGDSLYLDSTGYHKATADDINKGRVIGVVTQTGVPGPDRFRMKPIGGVPVEGITMPSGDAGTIVYLAADGSLTTARPASGVIVPLYVKLTATSGLYIVGQNVGPKVADDVYFDNGTSDLPGSPVTVQQAIESIVSGGLASGNEGLAFGEGANPPPEVSVDDTGIADVAMFEPGVVQDVVFRIPAGYPKGVDLIARYHAHNAAANNKIKLQLEYRVVDAGNAPNGGTLQTDTFIITPVPTVDTVVQQVIFTIPEGDMTDANSWVNCTLTRLGTDGDDGYTGSWCLMSISPRRPA